MAIKIEVMSIETIKPSSPTPKSLQKHQLSLLDQLAPPIFTHLVYFYPPNPQIPTSRKSHILKQSLSETLSRFYPLAGRLVGNLYVDCNDAGIPFFEAQANCQISQIITDPDPTNASKFVPYKRDEPHDFCMAVQATYFRCGGLAVAHLITHKLADALSLISFGKFWAAAAINGAAAVHAAPEFDAASFFPPRDISGFKPAVGMVKEEIVARIFTFPAARIAALQKRYSGGSRRPSRVAALSAFIWAGFMSVTKPDPRKIQTVLILNAINLRTRADPPLSEYLFGNAYGVSTTKLAEGDGGVELVEKVREVVRAVDGGYVARLKDSDTYLNFLKEKMAQNSKGEVVWLNFSSLCGFPLYEADFGWGKPVWVGQGPFPYKNLVIFTDTKSGGGIEALVHLTKQDMKKFEANLEIEYQMLKSNL